jgi:hypothetical protein
MRKEYHSTNGLWLIITSLVIYVVTIYYLFDKGNDTFIEYMLFASILVLNTLMIIFFGKEIFSKKPLLILEDNQLIYRGMLKTHTILYKDIRKIQRTYNGTRNKKQVNRIGIELLDERKPVFIIVQSIDYDADKLFEDMKSMIYKKKTK